jgi:hypothetical protein
MIVRLVKKGQKKTLTYNSVGELATQVATFNSTPLVNITYHGGGPRGTRWGASCRRRN